MEIKLNLNGKDICQDISPDMLLIDFLRKNGCLSVKRGCDTSNCGLCTVFMDDKPILSCSILALRVAEMCIRDRAYMYDQTISDGNIENDVKNNNALQAQIILQIPNE